MRNINSPLAVVIYSTLFLFLSSLPLDSYAAQSIYTIQIGSFTNIVPAQKQFDSIVQELNEKELDYLRIEKIGKYYSIRLGKFEDRATAEKFFEAIKPQLSMAIIMKAYIIDERIVRLYKSPSARKERRLEEKPLSRPPPKKIKPRVSEKTRQEADKRIESLEKQIKIISELVNKKDFERALEITETQIVARPESAKLNGWYGTVLLKMNRPAKAIKYFQKAVELSPEVSDYHNGFGYCLSLLNRFNEAIDEFNKAVTLEPAHIDALTGLGIAYAKIGKKDKAMDVYNKLKDLDRDTANKLLKIIKRTTL